jgi:serine/threonine protein kinase
LEDSVSKPER